MTLCVLLGDGAEGAGEVCLRHCRVCCQHHGEQIRQGESAFQYVRKQIRQGESVVNTMRADQTRWVRFQIPEKAEVNPSPILKKADQTRWVRFQYLRKHIWHALWWSRCQYTRERRSDNGPNTRECRSGKVSPVPLLTTWRADYTQGETEWKVKKQFKQGESVFISMTSRSDKWV